MNTCTRSYRIDSKIIRPPTLHQPSRRQIVQALLLLLLPAAGSLALVAASPPVQASPGTPPDKANANARIVSINGAMTEIAYLLGAGPLLVGTDTTSAYPVAAQKTAKVGYMRQLSAEGVLSLRPSRLMGSTEAGPAVVLEQIRRAGVLVELVQADHTWAEVARKVAAVGRATGLVVQASQLQAQLEKQWQSTLAQVSAPALQPSMQPTGSRRPPAKALFVLAHSGSPQVSGDKTAAHAMLQFAGLRNVFGSAGSGSALFSGYRPMTPEALAAAAPELIITTQQGLDASGGADAFWSRPGLSLTPAYQKRALVAMDALELLGFGPRLPQSVLALHRAALKALA